MTRFSAKFNQAVVAVAVMVTALVGASLYAERNVPANLLPHGVCFTWLPSLLWLHVISDALIGLAYLLIPISLLYFVSRREDLPFNWVFLLFGLFIVSCGATHVVGIWTIWNPDYWFAGAIKAITAASSVLTAIVLFPLIPKALAIPTTDQLRRANDQLEREVAMRKAIEEELRVAHVQLEQRVAERTQELAQARSTAERLRTEAEEANRMKDRFLAKVTHELRTPLQATLSWTGVLASQVDQRTPAHTTASRIAHNVASQARLIDDLLDISRILSGKLKLDLQTVPAIDVVERAVAVIRPQAEKAGVAIDVETALEGVELTTDPGRLEQVIWNLLGNAVQASERGQRVRLNARRQDGSLVLVVEDQGCGIAPSDLPTLFEPFRQARPAGKHSGLGLGLAIARSIVALFGGTLTAYSKGLQQGAAFKVEMPTVLGGEVRAPMATISDREWAALSTKTVLYVEDNDEIADAVAAALRPKVARLDVAYSAVDALSLAKRSQYDILICDLYLGPQHSGHDLLRLLRRDFGFAAPAVALSAFGSEEERRLSNDAGFVRHLTKPVGATDLARAILDVTGAKQSARASAA